jgi:hypothetical protein
VGTLLRISATVLSALATFYFVFWLAGALLFSLHLPLWLSYVVAAVVATVTARYVWRHMSSSRPGLGRAVALGALITGAIGFSAGFFGPIILTPGANQGPLLGIFHYRTIGSDTRCRGWCNLLGSAQGSRLWRWCRLTIVGGVRERLVVTRRGRGKTVYARGA